MAESILANSLFSLDGVNSIITGEISFTSSDGIKTVYTASSNIKCIFLQYYGTGVSNTIIVYPGKKVCLVYAHSSMSYFGDIYAYIENNTLKLEVNTNFDESYTYIFIMMLS